MSKKKFKFYKKYIDFIIKKSMILSMYKIFIVKIMQRSSK